MDGQTDRKTNMHTYIDIDRQIHKAAMQDSGAKLRLTDYHLCVNRRHTLTYRHTYLWYRRLTHTHSDWHNHKSTELIHHIPSNTLIDTHACTYSYQEIIQTASKSFTATFNKQFQYWHSQYQHLVTQNVVLTQSQWPTIRTYISSLPSLIDDMPPMINNMPSYRIYCITCCCDESQLAYRTKPSITRWINQCPSKSTSDPLAHNRSVSYTFSRWYDTLFFRTVKVEWRLCIMLSNQSVRKWSKCWSNEEQASIQRRLVEARLFTLHPDTPCSTR